METKDLAKTAYNAYGTSRFFKSWDGKPMPSWEELGEKAPEIQEAWMSAINGIFVVLMQDLKLEGRDLKTIRGATVYKSQFSEAGFPGHNLLLLVAKLAGALRIE